MENTSIVLFSTKEEDITLKVRVQNDTVWLNRQQMSQLFGRDIKTIGKHINNALREELDESTVAKFATVQTEGNRSVQRDIEYYNLDVIISVGYHVKSRSSFPYTASGGAKSAPCVRKRTLRGTLSMSASLWPISR